MSEDQTPENDAVQALADALYADADLGPGYMYRDDCEHLARRVLATGLVRVIPPGKDRRRPPMNGPEHFAAAEACLEASNNRSDRYKADRDVQQARVHAQLAGVALALDMARAHLDTTPLNVREWEAVTAPIEDPVDQGDDAPTEWAVPATYVGGRSGDAVAVVKVDDLRDRGLL